MILNRLGVITDEISPVLTEALDWIRAEGLRYAEIRMVDGKNVAALTDDEVDRVRREAEARGLSISGVASPLFKCALDPLREVETGDRFGQAEESVEAHFGKLARVLDIAERLGTRFIRIFSFWRERMPELYADEIAAHLSRAAAMAEARGLVLLLENERSCNGGYAAEVAAYVKAVDSPSLRALWDPGNEAQSPTWSFPRDYETVRDALAHVHIKDSYIDASGKPHCVPVGQGRVPYAEQIRLLEADGYRGLYIIETHYVPPGGTKADGTKQTLDGLRVALGVYAGGRT
ncbi:MAG TPA: sugar phosphate isomerase/epimerase family protein [Paenibacillus sp.]|nr:sugar phosphate isomerase/epimerase family protein [Paenibacillus sp.]